MEHIQPGIKSALEEVTHHRSENLGAPETYAQREARIVSSLRAAGVPESKIFAAIAENREKQARNALPTATGIEAEICEFIARRQQLGIHKYGQTVADNPLPLDKWLQHMIEELLDGAIYAKRAQAELKARDELVFADLRELIVMFSVVEAHLPNTEQARTAAKAIRMKIFSMVNGEMK